MLSAASAVLPPYLSCQPHVSIFYFHVLVFIHSSIYKHRDYSVLAAIISFVRIIA